MKPPLSKDSLASSFREDINRKLKGLLDPKLDPGGSKGELNSSIHVLELLQNFLEWNYWFGIIPLDLLSEMCPDFQWKRHDFDKKAEQSKDGWEKLLMGRLQRSDLFWPVPTCNHQRWVSARWKTSKRKPQQLCGYLSAEVNHYHSGKLGDFIRSALGKSLARLQEAHAHDYQEGKFQIH